MTTYYTVSGNPPAQTRGTSPSIRAEFALIQTGFTGVNADLQAEITARGVAEALLAPRLSPTFTGTPVAPTAPAGTNTTQLATTAFVVATSLNASLPGQGGNAGKLINTDGATASWSSLLNSGVLRWKDGADPSKLLAWNLAGITTATTRTVTLPDKNGTLAMLSDTGMALLAVLTPTAAATVDFLTTFSATYDQYLIVGDGLKPGTDDILKFRFANAGTADAGSNYYPGLGAGEGSTPVSASATSAFACSATTTAAGQGCCFALHVLNANDATNLKAAAGKFVTQSAATPAYVLAGQETAYVAAAAISGIRFFWSAGANFAATGRIRVYGYSN